MTQGGASPELVASLRAEYVTATPERRAQIMVELERLGVRSTVVAPRGETR